MSVFTSVDSSRTGELHVKATCHVRFAAMQRAAKTPDRVPDVNVGRSTRENTPNKNTFVLT